MSILEFCCPTIVSLEYSNITEAQEKDLKANYMVKTLKEEMPKSFKEIQEKTNS